MVHRLPRPAPAPTMTTRAKLGLCVGLIGLGVGVVLVCVPSRRPPLEITFERYTNSGGAVLNLTNRGGTVLFCALLVDVDLVSMNREPVGDVFDVAFSLAEHQSTQFVAFPMRS